MTKPISSHSTLQIEVTRRCNMNCKICMRQNLDETTLSLALADFIKILDSSNFQHVALHGWGEPLLNPQLFQMIKYAELQGISTELTTNATLLQANIEKVFDSGLSSIVFGIHRKKNMAVAMSQISELIERRNRKKLRKPKTYLDLVIYRGNQGEIGDLVEAAARLELDALVLHRVFSFQPGDVSTEYISVQEEKELFLKVKRLAREMKQKLYLPPQPFIPCRAVKHSIFVTSEGKVAPCPYLCDVCVGDALNGGIGEVIYSKSYIEFIKNSAMHPVCSKCPLGSTSGNFYS